MEVNGLVTVQGAPRWGRRHFGVPEGGAWDTVALRGANGRLGNSPDAPALELSLARMVLRATRSARLAAAGAPAIVQAGGRIHETGHPISLEPGEEIEVKVPTSMARVYVALPGGIDLKLCARVVGVGDTFACNEFNPQSVAAPADYDPTLPKALDVIPFGDGPLPPQLAEGIFTVGFRSNRVGIRLEGPALEPRAESLSEPACHGTIQVDNSGSLIILGPDGPTIGGYPKLGVIASHHLHHLGQLRPGAEIRFSACS